MNTGRTRRTRCASQSRGVRPFRLDDGEFLTINRVHYRLDGLVIQAIAGTGGVSDVENGTGTFVRLRLDDRGLVRQIADIDGRNPNGIEPSSGDAS